MADVSKIKLGSTTYDVKDATARSNINNLQTAINNIESITQTEIDEITDYTLDSFPAPVYGYDTVADMQADTSLQEGMICHTNGLHIIKDGDGAWYKISTNGDIACANGLYATKIDIDDNLSNYNLQTSYFGRIPCYLDSGYMPQGFAIINNDIGIFSMTNNTTCKFYYINLKTGNVTNTVTATLGHCNSMDYLASEDKILLVQNKSGSTKTQIMHILNPSDMSTLKTINLGFVGHSVSVDKKTGKIYIASETTINGNYALGIYLFDYTTESLTFIGNIVPDLSSDGIYGLYKGTVGVQQLIVYDGQYYILVGGHVNALMKYNSLFALDRIYNIDSKCFIYTYTEIEGIAFTTSGAIIAYGLGDNFAHAEAGVICGLLNGRSFDTYDDETMSDNYYRYSRCIPSTSFTNVYANGSEGSPFIELGEAISYAVRNNLDVLLTGDVTYHGARVDLSPANIHIIGSGESSITFLKTMYFNTNIRFEGASASAKMTLKCSNTTPAMWLRTTQFAYFKYVTFDCTNASNYVMRSYGFVVLEACDFTNTDTVYTTPVDLQNRGVGIYSSTTPTTAFNNKGTLVANIAS